MNVRELVAKFGVEFDDHGAKHAEHAIEELKEGAKELLEVIGGAEALHVLAEFVIGQVEMGSAIGTTADRIGIGVERLQELRFAGEEAGLSAEGVDAALVRLTRSAAQAAAGEAETGKAFAALGQGLTAASLKTMSVDELLEHVAEGMKHAKTAGDRLRIGQALLGREGGRLSEVLKNGKEGLEEMREHAKKLGFVLSKEQVAAARKAAEAMHDFHGAVQGVKNQIATYFMPVFTHAVEKLGEWAVKAKDAAGSTHIIEAAAITAGLAIAALFGPEVIGTMLVAGVALATMALAIEDIITWTKDGDSVLGRFIDKFLGLGASKLILDDWKAGLHIMVKLSGEWAKNLEAGWAIMKKTADKRKAASADDDFKEEHEHWEAAHAGWKTRKDFNEKWVPKRWRDKPMPEPVEPTRRSYKVDSTDAVWEERRTREVATERGMGHGPLALFGGAESAEDHAREQHRQTAVAEASATATAAAHPTAEAVKHGGAAGEHGTTINHHTAVTVNAHTGANPEEIGRVVVQHIHKHHAEANATAHRAVRQVAP
ncbi:MAG TPA: hypothetical protein VGO53_16080 [Steroidobacteraceae bacterium]|jgi:hypothetical protein|nr:hypothetical protein [Steroidobacteraceae bacterium]